MPSNQNFNIYEKTVLAVPLELKRPPLRGFKCCHDICLEQLQKSCKVFAIQLTFQHLRENDYSHFSRMKRPLLNRSTYFMVFVQNNFRSHIIFLPSNQNFSTYSEKWFSTFSGSKKTTSKCESPWFLQNVSFIFCLYKLFIHNNHRITNSL